MGLFSKLTGKDKDKQDFSHLQSSSSSGYNQGPPAQDYSHLSSENKGKGKKDEQHYAPPSSEPPAYSYDQPPSGPPPSSNHYYAPPPGAPPGFDHPGSSAVPSYSQFAPPPGPPPGFMSFNEINDPNRPPPVRSHWFSPTQNAPEEVARAGHDYCRQYPPYPPQAFDQTALNKIHSGDIGLSAPYEFRGSVQQISPTSILVKAPYGTPDMTLLSGLPIFSAMHDAPREKDRKTIYYQIKIHALGPSNETSLAIGFVNVPTPPFRLPGWHRGGLAVHSDDGHRYINDSYGGRDFTSPFRQGETIGLGLRFKMMRAEAFIIRDGREAGSWWVDEEVDASEVQEGGIDGLQGERDLYVAVGVCGFAEFEVDLGYSEWRDS